MSRRAVFINGLVLSIFLGLFSSISVSAQCGDMGFHASEFTPSWIWKGSRSQDESEITADQAIRKKKTDGTRYPNDYAKTFYCDAPWRVDTLDSVIPVNIQIEGTDADAINELHLIAIYDVSDGSEPPEPEEDFWGDYEFTPDSNRQVFKVDCGGCQLSSSEEGMYWRTVTTFLNDGSHAGTQIDGTALTPRNMGYTEADRGSVITLTVRIIYEENLNWTDIHDQDFKVYLGHAPLPRQTNWYLGDSHTHSWSSYYFIEMGSSGNAMFQSQVAAGLQWQQLTDHAYNMTPGKWQSMADDVLMGNTLPGFVALHGLECDDGYTLGDAHHFLCFDVPSYIETYENDPPVTQSLATIRDWSGFSYGAHTTTEGWLWSDQEIRDALAFQCFRGLEDYNERSAYKSEDTLHPWGGTPATGDWEEINTGWDTDLLAGINRWDRLLSEYLNNNRYEIFFMGGSDAHGSMNYHVEWDFLGGNLLYGSTCNALGKVRNAAYIPETFNQLSLWDALYNGRIVVTDGPFAAIGVTDDGTAAAYDACQSKIADTCAIEWNDPDASLLVTWTSSADWGDIETIQIFLGDETTGENPTTAVTLTPDNGMNGTHIIPLNTLLSQQYADGDINPDVYIRAIAYTYDPVAGPSEPGDCSVPGFNPLSINYQFRAITNPIWINVLEPQCINDGDVNGDQILTASDAQLAFMIVLGTHIPTADELCAADCNGDQGITAADAQTIFLSVLGEAECVDQINASSAS